MLLFPRVGESDALDQQVHLPAVPFVVFDDEWGLDFGVGSATVFDVHVHDGDFTVCQVLEVERTALVGVPDVGFVFCGKDGVQVVTTKGVTLRVSGGVHSHCSQHDLEWCRLNDI